MAQVERSEAAQKNLEARQQIADAFYRVFSTEDGKFVLEYLKAQAFFYTSTFTEAGMTNEAVRSLREGQRNLMLLVDKKIHEGKYGIKVPTQVSARSDEDEQ